MIKRLLILLLLLPLFALGQFQGGVIVVNGVAVHQPDTSAYKVINTIQQEGTALNGASRFYVTYLVSSTKAIGVWSLTKALYGFVGGTAASHKWNWKDMRDLDGAFRLVYGGTLIHNSNGVSQSSSGFINTKIFPSILSSDGVSIGYYINNATSVQDIIGSGTQIGTGNLIRIDQSFVGFSNSTTIDRRNYGGMSTTKVAHIASTPSITSNEFSVFRGGNKITNPLTGISTGTTYKGSDLNEILIFATNLGNQPLGTVSPVNISANISFQFTFISDYITDTQAIQASNIITFAQSILNRQ